MPRRTSLQSHPLSFVNILFVNGVLYQHTFPFVFVNCERYSRSRKETRLEMVIGTEIIILKIVRGLFPKDSYEKETYEFCVFDSDFHSKDHFESHLLGMGCSGS